MSWSAMSWRVGRRRAACAPERGRGAQPPAGATSGIEAAVSAHWGGEPSAYTLQESLPLC